MKESGESGEEVLRLLPARILLAGRVRDTFEEMKESGESGEEVLRLLPARILLAC